jgi:virginiamycin B lyase
MKAHGWGIAALAACVAAATPRQEPPLRASDILNALPDGAIKRQFIIDCTGCHQQTVNHAYPGGVKRSEDDWRSAIARMVGFAGPTTGFPVISAHAVPDTLARWLAANLPAREQIEAAARSAPPWTITEYMMPVARDLPHDIAITAEGQVLVTGMFSHRMYVLDPESKALTEVAIPVERANPRAVEIAPNGDWWVLLGGPAQAAVYDPGNLAWRTFDIGVYPHSIALDSAGGAWYNGHFTANPEIIGRIDRTAGSIERFNVTPHPELATKPGGPIPYELRAGRDGSIWLSELQGNRVVRYRPKEKQFDSYTMPTPHAGPRRLDVDAQGIVWIPLYGAGKLARLDPRTGAIREIALPIRDAAPYVVRVDNARNRIWIGTGAADVVFEFDPVKQTFRTHALPSEGAMIRHMAIHPGTGDVWLAYGASPGIAARIARIHPN